jgi:hypothetical protein
VRAWARCRGDDGDEIKKRIKKDIECRLSETAGCVTGKK